MSQDRTEALRAMLAQDANNSFVRYALAQACANAGRYQEAAAEYRELLRLNPDYVAGYYHGGQTLEKLGLTDEARVLYSEGLTACSRTGDLHTRSEIQAALDLL
ncbi:MAG: tetratricopeptide repeat protein [Candidatus Solibacter usitatus]|nr:tetratricopeptide repeat protein [Candidatus Solibacter usitatus]